MPTTRDRTNPTLSHRPAPPRERYDAGRALRDTVPLEAHAELAAGKRRADPLSILAGQDGNRIPNLVRIRYGRMSQSPFTYLRGAAAVMANDLAALPRTSLWVELCGDAHLGNFRWYKAPDRRAVFDLNDFDETLPGPFEWDLKRLAASVMVAARNNGHSRKEARAATRAAMRSYRALIAETSEMSPLDAYYHRLESEAVLEEVQRHGKTHKHWKKDILRKAARKNSLRAFNKLTDVVKGRRIIVSDPPRIVRAKGRLAEAQSHEMAELFERYRQTLPLDRRVLIDRFRPVDVARKVVGVGSVGTRCMIMLLESGDGTPLFLQFKQAVASVLEPYLGACVYKEAGRRVVEGQRLIQATSDVLLGWARWKSSGRAHIDYYFRQLWDGKGRIDVDSLDAKRLAIFAGLCGKTLACAHARSGDAMMIRGYIGEDKAFDDALVAFAEGYADRTAEDHAQLTAAIDDGAIKVIREV